jgi:SAM-dependent methyltransferase
MPPLALYEAALDTGGRLAVHYHDGSEEALDVTRWTAPADAVDATVLARCTGPTIDLGCGPGRLVAALAARGIQALGVDLSPRAVTMARARGAAAITRDLFAVLPGGGLLAHCAAD